MTAVDFLLGRPLCAFCGLMPATDEVSTDREHETWTPACEDCARERIEPPPCCGTRAGCPVCLGPDPADEPGDP